MSTPEMSTVVSNDARRFTIVNLKQVNELPLRNALQSFDKNGDGKIDITELQKIIYWYGLWKYASFGLCMIIMTLVWSTFGLTIWAINLTKEYSVDNGVLTGGDEVVKMSVASTHIPLSWATLLDRRHLDALESLTIDVTQGSGKFSSGVYHMKVASYVHANSTYLKLFGADGSRVWVNSGTVVLHHPDAEEAVMVCGAAACNTLAVDVQPEYLQQLVQRSAALLDSHQDFEVPNDIDGISISKAAGEDVTCQANIVHQTCLVDVMSLNSNFQNTCFFLKPRTPQHLIHGTPADHIGIPDWFKSMKLMQDTKEMKNMAEDMQVNTAREGENALGGNAQQAHVSYEWKKPADSTIHNLIEGEKIGWQSKRFSGALDKEAIERLQRTSSGLRDQGIRYFKDRASYQTLDDMKQDYPNAGTW